LRLEHRWTLTIAPPGVGSGDIDWERRTADGPVSVLKRLRKFLLVCVPRPCSPVIGKRI